MTQKLENLTDSLNRVALCIWSNWNVTKAWKISEIIDVIFNVNGVEKETTAKVIYKATKTTSEQEGKS